jgi:hypothetical protein
VKLGLACPLPGSPRPHRAAPLSLPYPRAETPHPSHRPVPRRRAPPRALERARARGDGHRCGRGGMEGKGGYGGELLMRRFCWGMGERMTGGEEQKTRTQTRRTHIHMHIPSRRTYHIGIGIGTTSTPSTTAPSFWLGDTHTHDRATTEYTAAPPSARPTCRFTYDFRTQTAAHPHHRTLAPIHAHTITASTIVFPSVPFPLSLGFYIHSHTPRHICT